MLIREAIILAAGLGTRIKDHTGGTPKPAIRVLGLPLILYPIAVLFSIGVRRFYIVVNNRGRGAISRILRKMGIKAHYIINKEPKRGNGYSLVLGMKHIKDETFFLSMADHIFDPRIPYVLLHNITMNFDIIVGADSRPCYISIEEATKILTVNDVALDIGKFITNYTHVDIGLFIMRRSLRRVYQEYAKHHHIIELASLIKYSIEKDKKVIIADIKGLPWIDIDTVEDLEKARDKAKELLKKVIDIAHGHFNFLVEKDRF